MNLLLLLSALLSAIGGLGQVVRGAPAPETVCASAVVTPLATATAVTVAARPIQALPRLHEAPRAIMAGFVLRPVEPFFARRRRE